MKTTHPIEPEELMAYLDGELPADRAAAAASHLQVCVECQGVVDELRGVSQTLKSWEVQPHNSRVPDTIADALAEYTGPQKQAHVEPHREWRLFRWPTIAWAAGFAASVLILFSLAIPNLLRARLPAQMAQQVAQTRQEARLTAPSAAPVQPSLDKLYDRREQFAQLQEPAPTAGLFARSSASAPMERKAVAGGLKEGAEAGPATSGPMIIRTADLILTTKEFDKARAAIESILKRHRGYVASLKAGGAASSARTLTGTLRVPADQLDATLTELKTLGRVESESQGGQDVTSQYVDLEARLANARNTEKRLTDLLSQRTGRLSDVLEVEQEVDRVRGEIEQMEAERKNMSSQVSFATVSVTVSEDYKAQLEVVPPSTSTRLSNAAVEGYRSMVDGVVGVMLFLLSCGPSLLLWGALLFLPARLAWKMMRRRLAQ